MKALIFRETGEPKSVFAFAKFNVWIRTLILESGQDALPR
jgi:hypothetical protein